jgi:ABC-2 type transport system ATP-binding protein
VPAFVLHEVGAGQRHVATLPAAAAGRAVAWAESLQRGGRVEEYRLGPATLEDVYVELVGRADALANGNGTSPAVPAAPTRPTTMMESRDVHAA